MFGYAVMFLLLALVAAALGFSLLFGAMALIARVLAGIFVILFLAALLARRRQS